jgi:hypothetical protein
LPPLFFAICISSRLDVTFAKILKYLADKNDEASAMLVAEIFHHVQNTFVHGSYGRPYIQCGGASYLIFELTSIESYRQVTIFYTIFL